MQWQRRKEPVTKPAVEDLEAWLEHQVGQLGTPSWWRELVHIKDACKFAWKIRASFYVPEVGSQTNPGQLFSAPPAPRNLNRGTFYPEGLEYQDVRQRPALLTVAYCRCLQHWAEKHYPLISPEACPLAKSMRELQFVVSEFLHITVRDILEGLHMNQPKKAALPLFNSLFSQVLSPLVDKQETTPVPGETRQANVVMRPHGRAQPFPWIGLIRSPICMPRAPMRPVSSPAETVALMWSPALPQGLMAVVAHLNTPEPPQPDPNHLMDMMVIGAMAPKVSHMHASRVVQDDSTGSIYLDTITASIERMMIGGPNVDVPAKGSTTEMVTRWE